MRWCVLKVVVGITGASGAIYGYRLLEELSKAGCGVSIILSDMGKRILWSECRKNEGDLQALGTLFSNDDLTAPIASGSQLFDAMVISPCSMKTLASIANGITSNLLTRVADVALKERRRLILVTRETPLSMIHIRNMLKVTKAGAVVMPASPGFYHEPKSLGDLVDHVVGKVLDQLGIKNDLYKRWGA